MLSDFRFADHSPVSDSDFVLQSAGAIGVGEFDLFELADRWWHGDARPEQALELMFVHYLHTGAAPPWVRRFCQTVLGMANTGTLDPRRFGARPFRTQPLAQSVGWASVARSTGAAVLSHAMFLLRLA